MPRKRLYHTSAEIKRANAEKSLRWYHKTLISSDKAIAEDTALVSRQKKRNFGADTSSPGNRCSRHTSTTHSEDEEAFQISFPTKEEDEYWKIKLSQINYALAHI
ncbi:hypothetical protein MPER_14698, partial [Moniliophthora perniciosa FA553]